KSTQKPQGVGKRVSSGDSQIKLAEQRSHSLEIESGDTAVATVTPGVKSWDITDENDEPAVSLTQDVSDSCSLSGEDDNRDNEEEGHDRHCNDEDIEPEATNDSHRNDENVEPEAANDSHRDNDDIESGEANDGHHDNEEPTNNNIMKSDDASPDEVDFQGKKILYTNAILQPPPISTPAIKRRRAAVKDTIRVPGNHLP
ncbi:hypothetical protein AAF712_016720, partial [Marasmius tenuissimus]